MLVSSQSGHIEVVFDVVGQAPRQLRFTLDEFLTLAEGTKDAAGLTAAMWGRRASKKPKVKAQAAR